MVVHNRIGCPTTPPWPLLIPSPVVLPSTTSRAKAATRRPPLPLQGRAPRAGARSSGERYGMLSLLVPAILPPPAPFKVFVLLGCFLVHAAGAVCGGDCRRPWHSFRIGLLTVCPVSARCHVSQENGPAARPRHLAGARMLGRRDSSALEASAPRQRLFRTPAPAADIMP